MRQRLKAADSGLSPERALEELQRLQQHQIRINPSAKPINGISRLSETHNRPQSEKTRSATATFSVVVHVFELGFININNLRV